MRTSPKFPDFDRFEKLCLALGAIGVAALFAALVWSVTLPH